MTSVHAVYFCAVQGGKAGSLARSWAIKNMDRGIFFFFSDTYLVPNNDDRERTYSTVFVVDVELYEGVHP